MHLRSLYVVPFLAAAALAVHCGGTSVGSGPGLGGDGGPGDDGGGDGTAPPDNNPDATGTKTAKKVDVLFVVDNSSSMGDKSKLLAASSKKLVSRIAASGDVHVGVITTSLGSFGGDVCPSAPGSALDGRSHLQTKDANGAPVAAAAQGFLSYTTGADVGAFAADVEKIIAGVGQTGCGLEAQLEAMYRFLSAPDPSLSVVLENAQAQYSSSLDVTLLDQRAAFLRPDSAVVVVMLTDEDDSSVDPLSIGGQGWAFMANQFPGSTVFRADGKTTTAPRAASPCATNPLDPGCTSCAFAQTCNPSDAACQALKSDPECQKNGGYWGPAEDQLNVRFFRMKQRFGIDPQFPISRYVNALTKVRVPQSSEEHPVKVVGSRREIGAYQPGAASCTNPLFAAKLPTGTAGAELCKLPVGTRDKDLVLFALIGGVPGKLLVNGSASSWDAVIGHDPAAYDFTGSDPHMIQSTVPRAGLPGPSSTLGDNGTDPVHGREWDTGNDDLQFACTFDLPTPRTCTAQDPSCDCASSKKPPLCGGTVGQQIKGKAYPTLRELMVVRALEERGIVASICPTNTSLGYDLTMDVLAARITPKLQ